VVGEGGKLKKLKRDCFIRLYVAESLRAGEYVALSRRRRLKKCKRSKFDIPAGTAGEDLKRGVLAINMDWLWLADPDQSKRHWR
jgi:hypothetical protein